MRRMDFSGFNKEKLLFLTSASVFAVTLYFFLAYSPIELSEMKPIGSQGNPSKLLAANIGSQLEENAKITSAHLTRKTPFAPPSAIKTITPKDIKPTVTVIQPPPPPETIPPAPEVKKPEVTKKKWTAIELDIQLDYVGIVACNGETSGLVKSKDGETRSIKIGDKIPDLNYEVTDIRRTEIYMKDSEGRPFVLKNTHDTNAKTESSDENATKKTADEKKLEDTKKLEDAKKLAEAKKATPTPPTTTPPPPPTISDRLKHKPLLPRPGKPNTTTPSRDTKK